EWLGKTVSFETSLNLGREDYTSGPLADIRHRDVHVHSDHISPAPVLDGTFSLKFFELVVHDRAFRELLQHLNDVSVVHSLKESYDRRRKGPRSGWFTPRFEKLRVH